MAKPKLALIPAAQGSKLFSVLPSSGVGDFDFTRSGSATRINSQGLIETVDDGVSRLNYPMIDGKVVGCPHHILEPQRTNLFTYSEDFSNGSWQKVASSTITTNTVISPDSTLNASTFKASSSSYGCILRKITTFDFVSPYTISFYVKKNNYRYVGLRLGNLIGASDSYNFFDFDTETVNNTPAPDAELSFEKLTNGWYKLSLTGTPTSSTAADLALTQSNGSTINPTGTEEVYVFGAQLEEGSYPTSYIPTNGQSGGVTRQAETATNSGDASTFNDSEGVLMAEISGFVDTDDYRMISINAGDSANTLFIALRNDTGNAYFYLISGGGIQANYISDVNATNTNLKLALKYKENDVSFYVNGIKLYEDTSATMISGLNQLDFNYGNANGSYPFYGSTKQIQYFDSALNDSDLEKLTSWTSFSDMANGQLYSVE